jgi:hypothetical protein
LRRGELILLVAFAFALVVAAVAGLQTGAANEFDPRLSTDVSGPFGAKGLALTLERMGVRVERWRRPLFDVDSDLAGSEARELLALLDVTYPPTSPERRALARYVRGGGDLLIVGFSELEKCLGVELTIVGEDADSVRRSVLSPPGLGDLPDVHWTVTLDPDSAAELGQSDTAADRFAMDCGLVRTGSETLIQTRDSVPVMVRLQFEGGGHVAVLADNGFLSNRALKETDAGALLIPLLLADQPDLLVVDEYHHDLGAGRSLWLAAGGWLISNPMGWTLIQLGIAALAALALAAVRFGPALRVIERRRRSPQEHLEALAAGLERSNDTGTATQLIVRGLRRRLSAGAAPTLSNLDVDAWLAALGRQATPKARADISRLRELVEGGTSHRDVWEAAKTAETLWNSLGR